MAEASVLNSITFKGRSVELAAEFVLSAGLKPDINIVRVGWDIFDALQPDLAEPGDLAFHFTRGPRADYVLSGVQAIKWDVLHWGQRTLEGEAMPLAYRIALADFRHRFTLPRGGVCRLGVVNPSAGATVKPNSELMRYCLTRMGMADTFIPPEVDLIAAPRDLKWFCSHAPTELQKLLDRCGAVVVPHSNGRLYMYMIGRGADIEGPEDRRLPVQDVAGQDLRGRTVVFTSAPTPIMERMKLKGPSAETWEFVIQHPAPADPKMKDVWQKIEDVVESPQGMVASNYKISRYTSDALEAQREHYKAQVFKCIRLNPEKYGMAPLLKLYRRATRDDTTGEVAIRDITTELSGTMLAQTAEKTWVNIPNKVIKPVGLYGSAVMIFAEPIGTLNAELVPPEGLDKWEDYFVPPEENSLLLTVGREMTIEALDGLAPAYFQAGFRLPTAADAPDSITDGLVELSAEETDAALHNDPDVIHVSRPDLRLFRENNEDYNRPEVVTQARAMARLYIKGSDTPSVIRSVVGFFWVELNGITSEIRITQTPPRTSWKVNTWHMPGELHGTRLRNESKLRYQVEDFPHQLATMDRRSSEGGSGVAQPVEPLTFQTGPNAPTYAPPLVKPTTKEAEQALYKGELLIEPAAVVTVGQPVTITSRRTEEALIVNSMEIDRREHRLVLGTPYPAIELAKQADGRRTFLVAHDPDVLKDLRFNNEAGQTPAGSKWIQVAFGLGGREQPQGWFDKVECKECPEPSP